MRFSGLHTRAKPRLDFIRPARGGQGFIVAVLEFQKSAAFDENPRPIGRQTFGIGDQILCRIKVAIHRRQSSLKRQPVCANLIEGVGQLASFAAKIDRSQWPSALGKRSCKVISRLWMIGMLAIGAGMKNLPQARRPQVHHDAPAHDPRSRPAPLRQWGRLLSHAIRLQDQPSII